VKTGVTLLQSRPLGVDKGRLFSQEGDQERKEKTAAAMAMGPSSGWSGLVISLLLGLYSPLGMFAQGYLAHGKPPPPRTLL